MIVLLDVDVLDGRGLIRVACGSISEADRLERAIKDLRRLAEKEQDERDADNQAFRQILGANHGQN